MTLDKIEQVLSNITWKPSCVDMGWKWEVKEIFEADDFDIKPKFISNGFLIRTTFQRPDTHTGEMGTGYGRWMHVPTDVSEEGIVKTAWLCAELIVRHELMEAFLYNEKRIFDPHKSIKDLSYTQCDTAKELL